VLVYIFIIAGSQPGIGPASFLRVKTKGIVLMIAQYGMGGFIVDHSFHNLQRLYDIWSTINKIPNKYCLTLGILIVAILARVTQFIKKFYQLISMAVYITDDVVFHVVPFYWALSLKEFRARPAIFLLIETV
jgi:hypothetical protein